MFEGSKCVSLNCIKASKAPIFNTAAGLSKKPNLSGKPAKGDIDTMWIFIENPTQWIIKERSMPNFLGIDRNCGHYFIQQTTVFTLKLRAESVQRYPL